jgi:ribonuclease E
VDAVSADGDQAGTDRDESTSAAPEGFTEGQADEDGNRRGRGRDRDRGGRRERREQTDEALTLSVPSANDAGTGPFSLAAEAPAEASPVVAAQPVEAIEPVAPAAALVQPEPVQPAVPAVPAYELPLTDLSALATQAGLEWVQSDADKIRAVAEAIAVEPRPVHVPRERKPAVVLDEGPLVLVETRKDLSQIRLPFETTETAA